MQQAQDFKQSEQERKIQNRKEKSERDKKAQLEKNVKTAQKAVDDRTNKMKKLKVGFDNVEKDDGLGTAFSSLVATCSDWQQNWSRSLSIYEETR